MFRMEVARKNDSRLSLRGGGKNVPGGVKKPRALRARQFYFMREVIFC